MNPTVAGAPTNDDTSMGGSRGASDLSPNFWCLVCAQTLNHKSSVSQNSTIRANKWVHQGQKPCRELYENSRPGLLESHLQQQQDRSQEARANRPIPRQLLNHGPGRKLRIQKMRVRYRNKATTFLSPILTFYQQSAPIQ